MSKKVRIGVVEDENLVRQSLEGLVQSHVEFELVASGNSVENFLAEIHSPAPDIVLLDINLGRGMSGLEGIRPIKQLYPHCNIIMLTTFDDSERIFKALRAGASAYVTKRTPFPKLIDAIYVVHRGGSYMSPAIARKVVEYFAPAQSDKSQLSPRQSQIVEMIVEGNSFKMVADKLMISIETVRDHVKTIYKKLEIHSKGELISMKMRGDLD